MKIFAIVTVALGQTSSIDSSEISSRRYDDLFLITSFFMPDFDSRKYWAYGCNCLILGNLGSISNMGHGRPVDEFDTACKAYKDCVKCVQMEYGNQCTGELKNYNWRVRNDEAYCTNIPGTCERALCECDAQFGRQVKN